MRSAIFGGVLLGMIEGVGILLTRVTAPPPAPVPMVDMPGPSGISDSQQEAIHNPKSGSEGQEEKSSWFSWFDGEEKVDTRKTKEHLENDKFAPPAMPNFNST